MKIRGYPDRSARAEPAAKPLAPGTWLLFADRGGVAEKLAGFLKKRGGLR